MLTLFLREDWDAQERRHAQLQDDLNARLRLTTHWIDFEIRRWDSNPSERVPGRPKSDAGFRTVALPSVLVAVVHEHVAEFPAERSGDLIFKGPMEAALRRNNFHRSARWPECVAEAGLPEGFRFHDLRHTGNTLAASSGASTRELMHRMGHASMPSALIYQHATSKRDREIAAAIDERIGRGNDS